MIKNPIILLIVLGSLIGFLVNLKKMPMGKKIFRYLPIPFWCYFLPMVGASLGLFPESSVLYKILSVYLLPFCLALLIINLNIFSLKQMGRPALLAISVSMLSIVIGSVISFLILHSFLPEKSYKAVGALSASWMGGSANMLAVKESLDVPDALFAPMVIVDTVLVYSWMILLMLLAGYQNWFDRWTGSRSDVFDVSTKEGGRPILFEFPWIGVISFCLLLALISVGIGQKWGDSFSRILSYLSDSLAGSLSKKSWAILIVTTLSLLFSLTGAFRKEAEKTNFVGVLFLYLLLASMGARAQLTAIFQAPLFLVFGILCLVIHGGVLVVFSKLTKTPLGLLATASQACLGGAVSAPIVGAVYNSSLSTVGLLMAVLGSVLGTYLGIFVSQIGGLFL